MGMNKSGNYSKSNPISVEVLADDYEGTILGSFTPFGCGVVCAARDSQPVVAST